MTLEFFDKAFGFKGREALALMGVHTVGGYNTFVVTDNAYNWLRKIQMKLFNNKYYKVLSQRSSKVFDECTGTMEDEKAEAVWTAKTHVLGSVLKKPDPWATADRLGHLRWNQLYLRGPTCQKNTFGYEKDFETWNKRKEIKQAASAAGFNSGIEYCCHEKERGCVMDNSCNPVCTIRQENKERYLGPDIGFYFKWNIDQTGHPVGCPGFKNKKTGEDFEDEDFRKKGVLHPDCDKQDADDGSGQALWQTVEDFADNQELWMEAFVDSFEKVQLNGYNSLDQGSQDFWNHF